ncbi:MAG: putative baseplate assembly protein [Nostocaceae cyanobacterium]|nr:putative baseplate assembly protein [Nostocaceae cyanobacterium]
MSNSETPKPIYNRPGLPAIVYRIGDYNSFRQRLLAQLSTELVSADTPQKKRPLGKLTTRSHEDPAIALLDAWAVVADVLTFYQERIANEGYLRTATERRSVLELARTIGYELSPGVAASTYLAFTVGDTPGDVNQAIVPQGTPIMSIPTQENELPQTFETSAEILARQTWNTLKPRLTRPQNITKNIQQIYLEGINTQLQPGDWILLVGNGEQDIETYLLNVTGVEQFADKNYTLVTWEKQLPAAIPRTLRNPQIFAFRNAASLFGKNAPRWEDMPDEVKKAKGGTVIGGIFCSDNHGNNWTPRNTRNNGLPNTDILCLAGNQSQKYLFAGTPNRGIFRSQDRGNNWEVVNAGLTNLSIQTLYIEPQRGHIFAGTPGGGVFRSKDNGENWVPIHSGTVRVEGQNGNNWLSVNTGIPNTVVRSLLTYTTRTNLGTGTILSEDTTVRGEGTEFSREFKLGDSITVGSQSKSIVAINSDISLQVDSRFSSNLNPGTSFFTPNRERNYIFAGTDNGIYRSQDVGKNWIVQGLFDGLSDRVIHSLIFYEIGGTSYIFAGTDNGVYRSQDEGNNWVTVNNGDLNANRVVYSLIIYEREGNRYLFAGTNFGVYRSQDRGNLWRIVNEGLPANIVVYSLVNYEDGGNRYLFAGTNQGIFLSTNNGDNWTGVNEGLTTTDITSLAVKDKEVFVGSLFSGFEDDNWVNFALTETEVQIDLDTIYSQILEDSWVVLLDENPDENLFQTCKVDRVVTADRDEFNLAGEITRIFPEKLVNLKKFRRRYTQVMIESEVLALAWEQLTVSIQQEQIFLDPIYQDRVFLGEFIPDLQSGKTLIVSGKHIRAIVQDIGGFFVWSSQESKWKRNHQGLTNINVSALAIDPEQIGEYYLGTPQGVFYSPYKGKNWQPLNEGLTEKNVQALVISPGGGQVFIGTPGGIFRYSKGNNWQEKNRGLVHTNVQALVIDNQGIIFAGTVNGGVFLSRNNGDSWFPSSLANADIQTLTVNSVTGDLFAGTFQKGIFRSLDGGNTWQQLTKIERGVGTISSDDITVQGIGLNLAQLNVGDRINAGGQSRTIVAIGSNTENNTQVLTIDSPFRPDLPTRTPFTINTGLTNLTITSLLIVTQAGSGTISSQGTTVRGTNTVFKQVLKKGSRITVGEETRTVIEIISDTEIRINTPFSGNLTPGTRFLIHTIFAGTAGSGIFRSRNYGQRWEQVNTNLTDLEIRTLAWNSHKVEIFAGTASKGVFRSNNNGELWVAINNGLNNIDVQAIAISAQDDMIVGGKGILISEDGFYTTPVQRGDLLWVISPPMMGEEVGEEGRKWKVRDINGFAGVITTNDADLYLQPGTDEDGIVSEVCTIKNPPTDQENPILTLVKPLKYAYDPESVAIYGNVVMASHGETVIEVMGSGDGTIPNQSFILKKPPLTYVAAATSSGAASSLEVRVDGVKWSEVDTLYEKDNQLQGYIIRLTNDGTPIVTFGDGEDGARLPTGEENITATYRSGIGVEGQVGALSLTLLKKRPLGIVEVTNPLAATGAASPESRDQAKEKAPSKVRTLDRIVSLQDFEDFTRAFAGIGKAQAVPLWNGQSQLVHITIAGGDGSGVDIDTNLYKQLVAAIDSNRDPVQLVEVDDYEQQLFNVEAKLQFDPRYQAETLLTDVTTALRAKFAFTNRNFGQDVTASEIIATIQGVEGVVAVDLDALYKLGTSRGLEQSLTADLARWDEENNRALPAQLLLLNSQDIKLTAVPVL